MENENEVELEGHGRKGKSEFEVTMKTEMKTKECDMQPDLGYVNGSANIPNFSHQMEILRVKYRSVSSAYSFEKIKWAGWHYGVREKN